jgi:hypothetical protein
MLSVKQNFGVLYTKGALSGAIAAYRSAACKGEPLRFAGLHYRRWHWPVAGAPAIGVIALGWAGSLTLKNSRMDALAVTAFTQLDRRLDALHNARIPFVSSRGGAGNGQHCTASRIPASRQI